VCFAVRDFSTSCEKGYFYWFTRYAIEKDRETRKNPRQAIHIQHLLLHAKLFS
jgi:hypothetical protein